MKSSHADYLGRLEQQARQAARDDYYLWPRTPIGDEIQQRIVQRVGVSDYDLADTRSRPALILKELSRRQSARRLGERFHLLDIACGDAVVLWQIKKALPQTECYGLDCNKGAFPAHRTVEGDGVRLYQGFIQHLLAERPDEPFDVVLMLNTYRGWESADLREHERDLEQRSDAWFEANARCVIVTATEGQVRRWRQRGFPVQVLGKGEDASTLIWIDTLPTA
jgi:hypothetical protein